MFKNNLPMKLSIYIEIEYWRQNRVQSETGFEIDFQLK